MRKILLGSNSPRRKELLSELGLNFAVVNDFEVDESVEDGVNAEEVAAMLSLRKSNGYTREIGADEILLTADTTVVVDDKVLGKPQSRAEAVEMLSLLQGREHKVITAFTLRDNNKVKTVSVTTGVLFRELNAEEIAYYVDNFKPMDKAGAYGAQEWIGTSAILSFNGSYHSVVGLPTAQLMVELASF